jgi:hypothetical protein
MPSSHVGSHVPPISKAIGENIKGDRELSNRQKPEGSKEKSKNDPLTPMLCKKMNDKFTKTNFGTVSQEVLDYQLAALYPYQPHLSGS